MKIDAIIVIAFITIFLTENLFGWGLLQDKQFILFSVFLILAYLISDLFYLLTKKRWLVKFKIFLLLSFIAVAVFGATLSFIFLRNKTHVTGFINDSAIQTEIAGRFLLLGKNPYAETYTNTDLAQWRYKDEANNIVNPALFQNVTPPLTIILSSLGFRLFSQFVGWFDIRVFFLLSYLSILALGWLKFGFKNRFLIFISLIGLNPPFLNSMMRGTNDVLVLSFLLWSLYFLEKKKFIPAGILLGLGIATKQTMWFAAPFYFFFVWRKADWCSLKRFFYSCAFTMILFYLPFILWNFSALVSNLVFYVNSSPSGNYPIHPIEGYGFGRLLLILGTVKSIYAEYPFWLWQFGLGLPFLSLLLFLQKDKMSPTSLLYSYTAFVGLIWFFNRYFLESHLAFLIVLAASSYVWSLSINKSLDNK